MEIYRADDEVEDVWSHRVSPNGMLCMKIITIFDELLDFLDEA